MNFIFLQFMEVWTQRVPCKVNVTPEYERNGSRAKLTWRPSGVTYFAGDPLRSYFHEPQKTEFYFLNNKINYLI